MGQTQRWRTDDSSGWKVRGGGSEQKGQNDSWTSVRWLLREVGGLRGLNGTIKMYNKD